MEIDAHEPRSSEEPELALAAGFARIDDDPRPISEIPQEELLEGFGEQMCASVPVTTGRPPGVT